MNTKNQPVTFTYLCKQHRASPDIMRRALALAKVSEGRIACRDLPAIAEALRAVANGQPLRLIGGRLVEHRVLGRGERSTATGR